MLKQADIVNKIITRKNSQVGRGRGERAEISHELVNFRYVLASNLRPRDLESRAIPSRPRTLNDRQELVTNKAATYANNLPMECSKRGTKYN